MINFIYRTAVIISLILTIVFMPVVQIIFDLSLSFLKLKYTYIDAWCLFKKHMKQGYIDKEQNDEQ